MLNFWELEERMNKERKEKRRKYRLVILNIVNIALLAFSYNFIIWLLLLTGLVITFFIILILSMVRVEFITSKPHTKLKLLVSRTLGIIISPVALYLLLFKMNIFIYYYDIPYYLNKNYEIVTGKPQIVTHSSRGYAIQWINVSGIKLENHILLKIRENEKKILTFYYLPHSKFVVEIWE